MKFSITTFFQFIFRNLIIFMLVFVWIRYYSDNLSFACFLSAFITLVIEIFFKTLQNKKLKKLGLKQNELQQAESVINQLIFNTQTENINLFFNILEKKENVKKYKDFLIITNEKEENFALFPSFSYSSFSVDNLAKCFQKVKKHKLKQLIICTKSATKEALEIAKKAKNNVLILQSQEVYAQIFKAYDYKMKLENNFSFENTFKEIKFKHILKSAIAPNKVKSYFFSSLILLLGSYFVPFKLYYYIFASLLLILSFVSFSSIWWKKHKVEKIF